MRSNKGHTEPGFVPSHVCRHQNYSYVRHNESCLSTREQSHQDTSCSVNRLARLAINLAAQHCTIFPRRDLVMPPRPHRSQRVRGNPHVCVTTMEGIVG
jgi:hypothetical protein